MELLRLCTGRSDWAATARKESCCCTKWRRHGLWKRRGVEKSKTRLSHPAWKSRKRRAIPTFPQPRRRLVNSKTGHFNLLRTDRSSDRQDVRTSLRANLGNTTSVPIPPGQPATSLSSVFPEGRRYWRIRHRARTPRVGGKAGAALDVVVYNGAGGVRRGRRNCHRELFSYEFSAGMGNDWRGQFRAFLCGILVRLPRLVCGSQKRAAECLTACVTTLTACI